MKVFVREKLIVVVNVVVVVTALTSIEVFLRVGMHSCIVLDKKSVYIEKIRVILEK